MTWKPTWILLCAAAVLFAFIWFVERPIRDANLRQAGRTILPGFDPSSITTVEIKPTNAVEIRVSRVAGTSNQWQMIQPISYPAEGAPIMNLLNALSGLAWQERISAGELKDQPDAQSKYGFAQPQFELTLHGSGVPREILVGNSSALGDQVFLEVVGDPNIFLVNIDPWLKLIPSDKDQWRDQSLLNLAQDQYQSIQLRSPGRGLIELELDPISHLWSVTNPVTARADTSKINAMIERLQGLRVLQFFSDDARVDPDLYGLQSSPQTPELDMSFLRGTNLAAELLVGSSPTNLPEVAFARRQNPSNIVIIDRSGVRAWEGAYTNFLDYHFISVSPDSIATIEIQGEKRFVVRKMSDSNWVVQTGATNYAADYGLMRDWRAAFTNIQAQTEKTVATDVGVYGLTHPVLQYTLRGSNGLIAEIEFGTNKSGRIFERRRDETGVNFIHAEDFDRLPRAAWQLRDRKIWSFDTSNVISLTVRQMGAVRKYVRDPDGNWTFAPGFHGPPFVNWAGMEEGVHRLGGLRAVYWSGVGEAHLQDFGFAAADFGLTVELKRGTTSESCSIEFGARSPYSYPYASVMQNGQRLIFEFPVDLYENYVDRYMSIPAALRYHQ